VIGNTKGRGVKADDGIMCTFYSARSEERQYYLLVYGQSI
jgi:hypothetical protein